MTKIQERKKCYAGFKANTQINKEKQKEKGNKLYKSMVTLLIVHCCYYNQLLKIMSVKFYETT